VPTSFEPRAWSWKRRRLIYRSRLPSLREGSLWHPQHVQSALSTANPISFPRRPHHGFPTATHGTVTHACVTMSFTFAVSILLLPCASGVSDDCRCKSFDSFDSAALAFKAASFTFLSFVNHIFLHLLFPPYSSSPFTILNFSFTSSHTQLRHPLCYISQSTVSVIVNSAGLRDFQS